MAFQCEKSDSLTKVVIRNRTKPNLFQSTEEIQDNLKSSWQQPNIWKLKFTRAEGRF